MADLEAKALDAKTEMAVADALDEIRVRNARLNRTQDTIDEDKIREMEAQKKQTAQDLEDEEAARRAFNTDTGERVVRMAPEENTEPKPQPEPPAPSFQRTSKKKKNGPFPGLGIKKKAAAT